MTPEEKKAKRAKLEMELRDTRVWMEEARKQAMRHKSIVEELEALENEPTEGPNRSLWVLAASFGETKGQELTARRGPLVGWKYFIYDIRPGNYKERDALVEAALAWYLEATESSNASLCDAASNYELSSNDPQVNDF